MKVVHKQAKPKNVLFYGDFNCDTGFGQVSKELVNNWAKDKNMKIVVFDLSEIFMHKSKLLFF